MQPAPEQNIPVGQVVSASQGRVQAAVWLSIVTSPNGTHEGTASVQISHARRWLWKPLKASTIIGVPVPDGPDNAGPDEYRERWRRCSHAERGKSLCRDIAYSMRATGCGQSRPPFALPVSKPPGHRR